MGRRGERGKEEKEKKEKEGEKVKAREKVARGEKRMRRLRRRREVKNQEKGSGEKKKFHATEQEQLDFINPKISPKAEPRLFLPSITHPPPQALTFIQITKSSFFWGG